MKWGKLLFGVTLLSASLASCGDNPSRSNLSPFDSKYEVSFEFASNLANTWKASVDESIEYTAHLTVNSVEPDKQYRFKADYRGYPGQIFNYIEGSIDTRYSTIGEDSEHFRNNYDLSDGFTHLDKDALDSEYSPEYHYYYYDNLISFYAYGEKDGYGGYTAVSFNSQGLVTFLEWYEFEGGLSYKETKTATFERVA